MDVREFAQLHLPALKADEIRFNVQIAMLTSALGDGPTGFDRWTLGPPGHCATRTPGYSILLGDLDKAECRRLAEATMGDAPCGVAGADDRAQWFAEHAQSLGARFDEPVPQRLSVIRKPPRYPGAPGEARTASPDDAPLLFEWLTGFHQEAVPHDPAPRMEHAVKAATSGRYVLWIVDDEPVSMAAIARRLEHTGAIASVFTPRELRGRGYAGSATAAVVDRIFAEGKSAACLFTDLRNPMSNRCYAKIGFARYCEAWHYPVAKAAA